MRNLINTISFLFLGFVTVGCAGPTLTENHCAGTVDCARGTYCDAATSLCAMDCASDDECAPGMFCTVNGRCFREETPPPLPDTSPVLEIEPGSLEDVMLLFGNYDAEIVRFTLTNRSDRAIEVPSIATGFYATDTFVLTGSMRDVKFESARDRRVLMGPSDGVAGSHVETHIEFIDAFAIAPGEQITVVMRADLPDGYVRTEIDLEIGTVDGQLLSGLRYADTGEAVPSDRVANNYSIVRHLSIRSEATAMAVPGTVSVFMSNSGRRVILPVSTDETSVFHITAINNTDESARLSDLRIRVSSDDGRSWAEGGTVILDSIDVYDSRDGSWVLLAPGASGCGGMGCTFVFDSIRLAPGEMVQLDVRMRVTAPGRRLFVGVGEGFLSGDGTSDLGAIFHRITDGSGNILSAESVIGNQPGYLYLNTL